MPPRAICVLQCRESARARVSPLAASSLRAGSAAAGWPAGWWASGTWALPPKPPWRASARGCISCRVRHSSSDESALHATGCALGAQVLSSGRRGAALLRMLARLRLVLVGPLGILRVSRLSAPRSKLGPSVRGWAGSRCPAIERSLPSGVQKTVDRPAAGPRQSKSHVTPCTGLVDVGPLLAVDLDADEKTRSSARGDLLVLERLAFHHVAPVARRVADRDQERLVQLARARRSNASGPHAYQSTGLSLVLEQIERCVSSASLVCHAVD